MKNEECSMKNFLVDVHESLRDAQSDTSSYLLVASHYLFFSVNICDEINKCINKS